MEIEDVPDFLSTLKDKASKYGVTCQAVDACAVAGKEHIDYCVEKSIRAHASGENLAKEVGLEVLLYLCGNRQISRALELGVREGFNRLVLVFIGDGARRAAGDADGLMEPSDTIIYTNQKRDFLIGLHGITPEELDAAGEEAIPLLCRERSALLELEK